MPESWGIDARGMGARGRNRANESSVSGGIFAAPQPDGPAHSVGRMRANESSVSGGIFQSPNEPSDDFMQRLEQAEARDTWAAGAFDEGVRMQAAGQRPSPQMTLPQQPVARVRRPPPRHESAIVFGDDSAPESRVASTTNQRFQEKMKRTHQEAIERQQDKELLRVMVDELHMAESDAKREVDLYRKEQAQERAQHERAQMLQQQHQHQHQHQQQQQQQQVAGGHWVGRRWIGEPVAQTTSDEEYYAFEEVKARAAAKRRGKGGPHAPLSVMNAAGAPAVRRGKAASAPPQPPAPSQMAASGVGAGPRGKGAARPPGPPDDGWYGSGYAESVGMTSGIAAGRQTMIGGSGQQRGFRVVGGVGAAQMSSVPGGIFAPGLHS